MGRPIGAKNRKNNAPDMEPGRGDMVTCGQFSTDNAPAKVRAAAYIRVSTDEQAAHGTSLENQKERIAARVASKDWALVDVYEDAGFSGGTKDRPALTRLIADVEAKKIDAVVVYKLDRLSRRADHALDLIRDVFGAHNVEIISIVEELDTSTPTGRLMRTLLFAFAELERDTIKERLTSGRRSTAKAGKYSGGAAPIGYTVKKGDKTLTVDAAEAATVKRVFELKAAGQSLQGIADTLNAEGHKTKLDGRTRKDRKTGEAYTINGRFSPSQVWYILNRRDVYAGAYRYKDIEADGQHKPILRKAA